MAHDERSAFAPHPMGTEVAVWVVPGASRSGVAGLHADALKVRVSAPAERGRANQAVAALLGELVDARVELLSGASGRRKRFLVIGRGPAEVAAALDVAPQR